MLNFTRIRKLKKVRQKREEVTFNESIWEKEKPLIKKQNAIDNERKDLIDTHNKIHFPSWSKMLLVFLFINFTLLEIFIGWVTIQTLMLAYEIGTTPDFVPLVTLIGTVIGETISYGIYSAKSKAENTVGGVVYESTIHKLEMEDEIKG